MMTTLDSTTTTSSFDMDSVMEKQVTVPQQENAVLPFDSPLDQSLGSPASTRDFSNSPFHEYDFDFGNVEDAIMFPDHGTQQMHGDSYLAGVPLFADESMKENNVDVSSFPSSSQQKEEHERLNNATTACDFSFDAMTTHSFTVPSMDTTVAATATAPRSPSPTSSQGSESINQLAAVFVREYARTHALNDIGVLLRALHVAGIDVSDEVVSDILAAASYKSSSSVASSASSSPSSSPSPPATTSTGVNHGYQDHHHCDANKHESVSPSVSPMMLPARQASPPSSKTRSSLQSSAKEQTVIDTRHGRRFVCSICNKQFDRAFNLRTHAMTHIDPEDRDKPFMCPWSECAKGFSRKYDAERHYRSVHIKKGEVASKKQVQLALSGRHGHEHDDYSDDAPPSNG